MPFIRQDISEIMQQTADDLQIYWIEIGVLEVGVVLGETSGLERLFCLSNFTSLVLTFAEKTGSCDVMNLKCNHLRVEK